MCKWNQLQIKRHQLNTCMISTLKTQTELFSEVKNQHVNISDELREIHNINIYNRQIFETQRTNSSGNTTGKLFHFRLSFNCDLRSASCKIVPVLVLQGWADGLVFHCSQVQFGLKSRCRCFLLSEANRRFPISS